MTAMITVEESAPLRRARRPKGEATRRRILEATLAVIARAGVHGVTHRAVAAEAGVQLSLTTYFFRSLNDMIEQAYEHFISGDRPDRDAAWARLEAVLDRHGPAELLDPAVRRSLVPELAAITTELILDQVQRDSVGLGVEATVAYGYRLNEGLRHLVQRQRERNLARFADLWRRFGASDPELEAELTLALLQRLEFECAAKHEAPSRERIFSQLARLLAAQLGIPA